MRSSSALAGPTSILVTLATLMLQLALYDREGWVLHEWIQIAIVLAIAVFMRESDRHREALDRRFTLPVCFTLIAILAFCCEWTVRVLYYTGTPFEVLTALTLRNLMIGLATRFQDARSLKFASLASCFLALVSILWLVNSLTVFFLFLYSIAGMWWLMGAYWDRLCDCFLTNSERAIPWKAASIASVFACLVALMLLPFAMTTYYTTAIQGFLPSSGGTRWLDENAFGGVGDGPQMVSAKDDASSFGPIESELFLESQMPSLYDAFNEFSEPPGKLKKRKRQRAIPLGPNAAKENHQRRGANKKPGREFNALRQRKRNTPSVSDLQSRALLQVIGRVPVHLGLYTYDYWDGHELSSRGSQQQRSDSLVLFAEGGKNWARYTGVVPNKLLAYQDRHEIRIINLKTDRIPSPPNFCGVHIDKLHSKSMFKLTQDGLLAIDMEFIPQLSVLHVKSLQRRASQIPQLCHSVTTEEDGPQEAIRDLARKWTEGVGDGWPKVEAICSRLQEEYVLDPESFVPPDVDDAAIHFLLKTQKGPDYLFATSTALLLRSLGYQTRVVSGFYARPENYDRNARLTSVYAKDAHFWVEVRASSLLLEGSDVQQTSWIAVDPSPGYEVLYAPESIWSLLMYRVAATWQVVQNNPITFLLCAVLCGTFWKKRVEVFDGAITLWWRYQLRWGDVREQVKSTLRLLDRRAGVRGCPRPKGMALTNWQLLNNSQEGDTASWEQSFLRLANWAVYGEGHPAGFSPEEIRVLCSSAANQAFKPPRKRRN